MKPTVTSTFVYISSLLGLLMASALATSARFNPPKPCVTTCDAARRPLEILCFGGKHQLRSRTYVDTMGQQLALPVRLTQPARFGSGPAALARYLHLPGPWPGNVDRTERVIFKVLIGADGAVRDIRLVKGLAADVAAYLPLVRRRLQTMPRWRPARVGGRPVVSLQVVSVMIGC